MAEKRKPNVGAPLDEWLDWFWNSFLSDWIEIAQNQHEIGFYDVLSVSGHPVEPDKRSLLAQSRLLYTFSHLALLSKNPRFYEAAEIARESLDAFKKVPGQYCFARRADGAPTGIKRDERTRSYDLSFVILALSTWNKLSLNKDKGELEACWDYLETSLTDPATGLLLEDDQLDQPSALSAPPRAQNPHMHNFEAALQAFEMSGETHWLNRAAKMRVKGLQYFLDEDSGTIREFISPDLTLLSGRDGQYREIGHQYEWAWLLLRERELGGDDALQNTASRLLSFADTHGVQRTGSMIGGVVDAVASDLSWKEETFLLWPQTEAIKAHALRASEEKHAKSAREIALMIFERYFRGQKVFANQVDANGTIIWNEALSRLLYHIVLGFTEGARAGLWKGP